MDRNIALATTAFACLSLLAACGNKAEQQGAAPDQTNQPVNAAQDAASPVVGTAAAALGSLSNDQFINEAAQGDMYEIAAARLALMRSKNADVKKFADTMIKDHTDSSAKLKMLLTSGQVQGALPTGPDQRHNGMIDNLRGATDADFDNRYLDQQEAAHAEMLMLMNGYKTAGQDASLKAFAEQVAPVVQMHLDMVHRLKSAMSANGGGNAQ